MKPSAASLALAFAMAALPAIHAAQAEPAPQQRSASERRADMIGRVGPSIVIVISADRTDENQFGGAGFIYNAAQGYVVTNAHVVDDKSIARTRVVLADKRVFDAKIVGYDKGVDIAVLKLVDPPADLKQAALDTGGGLRVGNDVVAFGDPLDYPRSATKGIVSALHRDMRENACDDYIQIDAAVNEGNSGGPLFNERGEIVGINTMIVSDSGQFIGLAFSIPIAQAVRTADKLIADGKIHWGYLGATLKPTETDVMKDPDPAQALGVRVTSVAKDGPARRAGLAANDIITAFNGENVKDGRILSCRVLEAYSGSPARITYLHDGREMQASVTLGDIPAPKAPAHKHAPHRHHKAPHPHKVPHRG
jgi:serine protease Do